MQAEKVILSGFTEQFLREGDGDQLDFPRDLGLDQAARRPVGSLPILSLYRRLW
jgi:hypothetical protein